MARVDSLKNFLTDIADKFRAVLGTTDAIPHSEYDTKIDDVYEAGKKVHWEAIVQDDMSTYFVGRAWDENTFLPDVDIAPTESAFQMFCGTLGFTDLIAQMNKSKGKIDTSKCKHMRQFLYQTNLTTAPTISIESATDALYLITGCNDLHTIEKIIAPANGGCPNMYYMIWQCPNVQEVRFGGTFDRSINLQYCTVLSVESLTDLMVHLKNFKGTSQEFAYTLTLSPETKAVLDDNNVMIDGVGWREYLADKGWNVA